MPIETNLGASPYYDDLDPVKNFYRVLFKPSVSVQVRELNQLQSLFQQQIERLGNNIFKRGTIIDGVNFIYYPEYPYVKILDTQIDGAPANPSLYLGQYVRNSSNLVARVVNYEDGFESTDPDLKTIYLKYVNSGDDSNTSTYSAGQTLTVYDANNAVIRVTINNGGSQFSNSDIVVFMPAMAVNTTSGSWSVGNIITQNNDTYTAYAEVTEVNTTVIPTKTVLKVKPRLSDLLNVSVNSLAWTFTTNTTIANSSTVADVDFIYGTSATAEVVTDGSGKVIDIVMTANGSGYVVDPHTTIKPKNALLSLNSLSLTPQTYISQVRVASVVNAVGKGYAFGITEGIIYQKGHFIRVEPQTIIVDKYSTQPNNLSVAFETREEIIDSNIDTSLLDNVLGTENETAPGADRLKLIPELVVVNTSTITGNDDIFPIVEWSEGLPYKQNKKTSYNIIGDEMATRTKEQSGNFVKDKFLVTTRSPLNSNLEANTVSLIVDTGVGYVSGYRVETTSNFSVDINKGIDTNTYSNTFVSLNYGNYFKVKEVAGIFQFHTGDQIDLYDTAKTYLSNTDLVETSNTNPVGTKIGTARIRSFVYESGVPGTVNAIYRMYIFDMNMIAGKNFSDTKAIYYNGTTYKGIADVVLELDGTTNANIAKLYGINNDKLLFYIGYDSPKNANQVHYQYRTLNQTAEMTYQGNVVITLASAEEYFPYTNALSDFQESDVYVIPLSDSLRANAKFTGTLSVSTTSANVTGTGTTFINEINEGDYVYLAGNSTQTDVKRVTSVVNNTVLILDSNVSFTNTGANGYTYYPKYVPIPINNRTGYTANVDATGKNLRIYLNKTLSIVGNATVGVAYNIERRDATQTTKTINRDVFVKIQCNTHSETVNGPWCLGVPDIVRLKKVYVANTTTVNTNSSDITSKFYIDHNQTTNYYGLGYLYADPYADLQLSANDVLLVQFDALTVSGSGFYTIASYVATDANTRYTNDSKTLAASNTSINSFEIPELYDAKGEYYDLINYIDFRPYASNTANLSTTSTAATINPAETLSFGNTADPTNNKKFPVPDAILRANVEVWQSRIDSVFLNKDGKIIVAKGNPNTQDTPEIPSDSMQLTNISIPAYPNLPENISSTTKEIINTRIANEIYSNRRIKERTIRTTFASDKMTGLQPVGYTMEDIGNLKRRIEDLEYYTALSLLEANIKDKAIPSSISPNINRFKFGFFTDDYSTVSFTDIDNPEYSADIEDDKVVPAQEIINIGHEPPGTCPYTDMLIISQKNATGNVVTGTPSNTVSVSVYAKQSDKNKKGKNNDPIVEPALEVVMSSIAGTATLWGHFFSGSDKIYIYQGNTLIATGDDALPVSNTELIELQKDSFFNVNDKKQLYNGAGSGSAGSDAAKETFKIVINHSPSGGRNYKIVVNKTSLIWRYRLDYPIDNTAQSSNPCTPPSNDSGSRYNGTFVNINPTKFQGISLSVLSNDDNILRDLAKGKLPKNTPVSYRKVVSKQKFEFRVTGLKPNTKHTFYIRDKDDSAQCRQTTSINNGLPANGTLISNERGVIEFDYFYEPQNTKSDWTVIKSKKFDIDNNIEEASAAKIVLINNDNTSSATGFIGAGKIEINSSAPSGTPYEIPGEPGSRA